MKIKKIYFIFILFEFIINYFLNHLGFYTNFWLLF